MKIGLLLGGGGGFGAYQVGVIEALTEYKLMDQVEVISSTSIGTLNALMILNGFSDEKISQAWRYFSQKNIYSIKNFTFFTTKRRALFDIDHMYLLMRRLFSLSKIRESDLKVYSTATEIKTRNIFRQLFSWSGKKRDILINDAKMPYRTVLGAMSVPILFGSTRVNQKYYIDGGVKDNAPTDPLIKEGCDVILSVPLATPLIKKRLKDKDVKVIDFRNTKHFCKCSWINHTRAMWFSYKKTEKYIKFGYDYAKNLLNELEKEGILKDGKFNFLKEGKFYGLTGDGKLCIKTK